jgi:hypothetical protein
MSACANAAGSSLQKSAALKARLMEERSAVKVQVNACAMECGARPLVFDLDLRRLVAAGSRTFQIPGFRSQISAFQHFSISAFQHFSIQSRAGCPADQSGKMPELRGLPFDLSTFVSLSTFVFRLSSFDWRFQLFSVSAFQRVSICLQKTHATEKKITSLL